MLLSICVPYYNHPEHLQEIIESVCCAKSSDFELVIVDNLSPINTNQSLFGKDERVRIIRRDNKVAGPENLRTCIHYGLGTFRMIVIDKDYIEGIYIDNFIETLRNNLDIHGGRCILNQEDNAHNNIICTSLLQKQKVFFYTEDHPTGYFFRQDEIEKDNFFMKSLEERYNPFSVDMLLARCASNGPVLLYQTPLVYSFLDRPRKCTSKSGTYNSSTGNLYFMPVARIHQMKLNIRHLSTLGLTYRDYRMILKTIYYNTALQVSSGYRNAMESVFLANHYGYKNKQVGLIEMMKNVQALKKEFIMCDAEFKTERIKIAYSFYFYAFFKLLKSFVGKIEKNNNKSSTDVCVGRWKKIVD